MAPSEYASRKSSPVHAVSAQEELGRKEQHMEERKREEERVAPSESNPDALRKKREGGAEEGNQTLFTTMLTCPSQR